MSIMTANNICLLDFPFVETKQSVFLPFFLPYGKAGELQILCSQGLEVNRYDFALDALTLKLSDFFNTGFAQV